MSQYSTKDIYKSAVVIGGEFIIMDTIFYKDKIWLVPNWIQMPKEGHKRPERIVDLKKPGLFEANAANARFVSLETGLTRRAFYSQFPLKSDDGHTVVREPLVLYPI
jgi:hypothetical protein